MRTFDYESFRKDAIPVDVRMYLTMIIPYQGDQPFIYSQKKGIFNNLVESARIRSTGASNRIEGIATSDKRLIALVEGKLSPRNRIEKEILGYSYCLNKVCTSYDNIPITPDYILQLHADLYQYLSANHEGRFKSKETEVEEPDPSGEHSIICVPRPAEQTTEVMQDLCDTYNRAIENNAAAPLILIMQFVYDFLCIRPFDSGNGRMSRLLMLLLLTRNGYPVARFISLESMIEKTKDSYFLALRESSQNRSEGTEAAWPFIRYMLGILLAAYREIENRVK